MGYHIPSPSHDSTKKMVPILTFIDKYNFYLIYKKYFLNGSIKNYKSNFTI